jgi:hypothetical protein
MIIPHSILPTKRNDLGKIGVEKIKTHILRSITPSPPPENCGVYEIMWKNMVERGRPQMVIY